MRDRLSVMLDSMITAVDEGLSFDGIVSLPEKGLESFGYRFGLAGLFDDSVEVVRKTTSTVPRVVNRILSKVRRVPPAPNQARRAPRPNNDNQNNHTNFRDSKFDSDDKDIGGGNHPPPAPQSAQEPQDPPVLQAPQDSLTGPHYPTILQEPQSLQEPQDPETPASQDPRRRDPRSTSSSLKEFSRQTSPSLNESPAVQQSSQDSQDSSTSQESQNPDPSNNIQPAGTPPPLQRPPTSLFPQDAAASQESPNDHGTGQPRKTRSSVADSPTLAPQESTVLQESQKTQQPRKVLSSSQESPAMVPQGSTALQAPRVDVENLPGSGESIEVQPSATYEFASERDNTHQDSGHEETHLEAILPRLRRTRGESEELRRKDALPRLQRGHEESEETRLGARPSGEDEHAAQKSMGEENVQLLGEMNIGQGSSAPESIERQPRRQFEEGAGGQ